MREAGQGRGHAWGPGRAPAAAQPASVQAVARRPRQAPPRRRCAASAALASGCRSDSTPHSLRCTRSSHGEEAAALQRQAAEQRPASQSERTMPTCQLEPSRRLAQSVGGSLCARRMAQRWQPPQRRHAPQLSLTRRPGRRESIQAPTMSKPLAQRPLRPRQEHPSTARRPSYRRASCSRSAGTHASCENISGEGPRSRPCSGDSGAPPHAVRDRSPSALPGWAPSNRRNFRRWASL